MGARASARARREAGGHRPGGNIVSPIAVGAVVFACTLGAALVGMALRAILPAHHLSAESRSTVTLGIGLVVTMTALVLGLVTASAKASLDALDTAIKHSAADTLVLDQALARYGADTHEIRQAIKDLVARRISMVWPQDSSRPVRLDAPETRPAIEGIVDRIRDLSPQTEAQRRLQSRALDLAEGLLQTRWMVLSSFGPSVPVPFLVVLLIWLTIAFATFGLFAPRNGTVIAVLCVCALSVAIAIFLILEMDSPFDGLIKVSADPLRYAHDHMAR
jgi:hypothetical protein